MSSKISTPGKGNGENPKDPMEAIRRRVEERLGKAKIPKTEAAEQSVKPKAVPKVVITTPAPKKPIAKPKAKVEPKIDEEDEEDEIDDLGDDLGDIGDIGEIDDEEEGLGEGHKHEHEQISMGRRALLKGILLTAFLGVVGTWSITTNYRPKSFAEKIIELEDAKINPQDLENFIKNYNQSLENGEKKDKIEAMDRYNEILRTKIAPILEGDVIELKKYRIKVNPDNESDFVYAEGDSAEKPLDIKTVAQIVKDRGFPTDGEGVLDPWFVKYPIAEGIEESSNKYEELGQRIENTNSAHYGTRALSRYQIMPREWIIWSMHYVGRVLKPTPQAIEFITYKQFLENHTEMKEKVKTPWSLYWGMAAKWYGGRKLLKGESMDVPFSENPETIKYADNVTKNFMKLYPAKGEEGKQNEALFKTNKLAGAIEMGKDKIAEIKKKGLWQTLKDTKESMKEKWKNRKKKKK